MQLTIKIAKNKMFGLIKILLVIFIIALLLGVYLYANRLPLKLYSIILGQKAKIGVAVIKEDYHVVIGNRKQPLLSVFKYFVALKVLNKLDNEGIPLNKKITVKKSMVDEKLYSPMLDKYTVFPFQISLAELLSYAVSYSDNNACDILIDYAGGIKEVEKYLHNLGYKDIEISVDEKSMNNDIKKQYLNKAYPKDVAALMKEVNDGRVLSKTSKEFLHEIMLKTATGQDKIKGKLPKGVLVAHKTGSSSRLKNGIKIADNDAGYVILPDGQIYYITIMVEDAAMSDKKIAESISRISKTIYDYFL